MNRSAAARLAAFALVLSGAFATTYAIAARNPSSSAANGTAADGHRHQHNTAPAGAAVSSSMNGYRLVRSAAGSADELLFVVNTPDGGTLTEFPENHGARLHLVAIRPDLSGFQHLHPSIDADGTIRVPDTFSGVHQLVFDFQAGDSGPPLVLGTAVDDGAAVPEVALPPASDEATVDGITVRRDDLAFTHELSGGGAVTGLEPYLGQPAHLIAIRQGDLAYAHLHPSANQMGGMFMFDGSLQPGTYRLFLQFGRNGDVVTVPFTAEIT
jgi:hypothetical protein